MTPPEEDVVYVEAPLPTVNPWKKSVTPEPKPPVDKPATTATKAAENEPATVPQTKVCAKPKVQFFMS